MQTFFSAAVSKICEAMVCGLDSQLLFQIQIPKPFLFGYYKDIFRAFLARSVSLTSHLHITANSYCC
jgi:hypothetical protein